MERNIFEMINEIINVSSVEGIDENVLGKLKLKAIQAISAFGVEKSKNPEFMRYPITESADFGAYITADKETGAVSLVFRQQLNVTMHYSFSTAEEILKGLNHMYGVQLSNTETVTPKM